MSARTRGLGRRDDFKALSAKGEEVLVTRDQIADAAGSRCRDDMIVVRIAAHTRHLDELDYNGELLESDDSLSRYRLG